MAIAAKTEMRVIPGPRGKPVPIGVIATGLMAAVTFVLGAAGAVIFFREEWSDPRLPARAFYSTTMPAQNGGIEPELLVNGDPRDLSVDPKAMVKDPLYLPRDALIEVRVRGAKALITEDKNKTDALKAQLAAGMTPEQ
jgi:hypothetical protein